MLASTPSMDDIVVRAREIILQRVSVGLFPELATT
jgi:hypothetical protein